MNIIRNLFAEENSIEETVGKQKSSMGDSI